MLADEADEILAFLGRYASQDMDRLSQTRSVVQLRHWANKIGKILREEQKSKG